MTETLYAVNGSGGAWTAIPATIPAHVVTIAEDGLAAAQQGLQVQFWSRENQAWSQTFTYPVGAVITINGNGHDGVAGYPAQNAANGTGAFNYRAPDNYCQVKSATVTATNVRVVEQETSAF